jgi:hypothetical protein
LFEKQDLVNCVEVFQKSNSPPQAVITNGIRFLLSVYGAPKKLTCLDKFRYLSFVKNTRNKKRVQLACLPPTSASAQQHLFWVYYQVQVWLGNKLDPEDWGWKLVNILQKKKKKKMRSPRALYSDKAPNWALGTINKCRQFRNISRYNSRWRQYLPA